MHPESRNFTFPKCSEYLDLSTDVDPLRPLKVLPGSRDSIISCCKSAKKTSLPEIRRFCKNKRQKSIIPMGCPVSRHRKYIIYGTLSILEYEMCFEKAYATYHPSTCRGF